MQDKDIIRYLSLEEVLILHSYQTEKFGGNPNILDAKLLESAIARPGTSLGGVDMFLTIFDKASVLAHGIIQNHPFVDGNKRTGIHAMLVFLEINGLKVKIDNKVLVKIALDIANNKVKIENTAKLLENYSD